MNATSTSNYRQRLIISERQPPHQRGSYLTIAPAVQ
jgi:hypothetical protein